MGCPYWSSMLAGGDGRVTTAHRHGRDRVELIADLAAGTNTFLLRAGPPT